jgi:DNA-binding GntR family transcriptional regulator
MANLTQAESAYQELRRRLLIADFRPRQRLVETKWARNLKVSRAAVRESLMRLHGEGLVYPGEKGGFFVTEFTAQDVHEIATLRMIFETAAFTLACDHATENDIQGLEENCRDYDNAVAKGYFTSAWEIDLHFHKLLVQASGNARLLKAYNRANIPLFNMQVGTKPVNVADFAETKVEHGRILEALRRKEKKLGVDLLRTHLTRSEDLILDDAE